MPHLITPEKLNGVEFHVAGSRDISKSLQKGKKVDSMRTLTANISVTAGPDVIAEQVFLSDVVCSYRARADQKYYKDYITVGIPEVICNEIWCAAKRRGFSVDTQSKTRCSDGYAWLDVNLRGKESPFYVVGEEEVRAGVRVDVKYPADDIRYVFNSLKTSLLGKMLCTMRMKKQYATEDGADSVLWSLGITPVEIYLKNTTSYRDRQRDVDLSLCRVDADMADIFRHLIVGRVPKGSEGSSGGRNRRRRGGSNRGCRHDGDEDGGSGPGQECGRGISGSGRGGGKGREREARRRG